MIDRSLIFDRGGRIARTAGPLTRPEPPGGPAGHPAESLVTHTGIPAATLVSRPAVVGATGVSRSRARLTGAARRPVAADVRAPG
ncbi:hypothetical protein [Crossiella cryophila]|uniref:Uncharacterized protein n=1 Tax=Crossiella cryophila TaxID=43355 RepID=A0A7W7CB68_9PSEU|nr:hypothetical protein [Crossiella cryophila]MBB4677893.1 hypothetical protein [Crossiella cryophila]